MALVTFMLFILVGRTQGPWVSLVYARSFGTI